MNGMVKYFFVGFISLFLLTISYAQNKTGNGQTKTAIVERIKKDIEILASDSLEGRDAGTKGEIMAKDYIVSQFEKMGASPLHNRKSFDKIKVLEKSFSGEQQNSAKATFSISSQNKQLKNFLGDRMMEELQKGISNGIYEKAAMQFDATGVLNNDLINQIYQKDKRRYEDYG